MECLFNKGKLKLCKDSEQHKAIIANTRGVNKHEAQRKQVTAQIDVHHQTTLLTQNMRN